MLDKITETLAPTKKQKFLYSLLGILWLGLFPPLPDWLPWVSLSTLFPKLDTDKATILLLLSTILLSYSVFLLRREKDAEIINITKKFDTCKSLALDLKAKNDELATQLRFKKVDEKTNELIKEARKTPKIKFEFPFNK